MSVLVAVKNVVRIYNKTEESLLHVRATKSMCRLVIFGNNNRVPEPAICTC
jgi:hypothetical protein